MPNDTRRGDAGCRTCCIEPSRGGAHYLYSDYCVGWLRSFRPTAGGVTDKRTWAGVSAPHTVSFGQDGAGELYMIANAAVMRIVRQ